MLLLGWVFENAPGDDEGLAEAEQALLGDDFLMNNQGGMVVLAAC